MGDEPHVRRKTEILAVLRRAGYSEQTVSALDAELQDPVDVDRDANVFLRHGITLDRIIDRMGGSP
jgi:hypothetical protein